MTAVPNKKTYEVRFAQLNSTQLNSTQLVDPLGASRGGAQLVTRALAVVSAARTPKSDASARHITNRFNVLTTTLSQANHRHM
eukprot:2807751-Pyramimonas_sp.AAC.2